MASEATLKVLVDNLLLRRAESAEQQRDEAVTRYENIKTNTSVKLGEFAKLVDIIDAECKRLGIEWHGSASTTLRAVIEAAGVKPGDVLFRPTGETRKVRDGEWYRKGDERYIRHDGYLTVSKFPIYRRIDSPAAAAVEAQQEPLPPPVSEAYRKHIQPLHQAIYERNATIREQAEEIERLRGAFASVARKCGVESGSPSAEFLVSVIEGWKQLVTAYRDSESPAPAEASEGSKRTYATGSPEEKMLHEIFGEYVAPAAESGKDATAERIGHQEWVIVAIEGQGWSLRPGEYWLTQEEMEAPRDFLSRRAEIESQLAQLSKYKRDAEEARTDDQRFSDDECLP